MTDGYMEPFIDWTIPVGVMGYSMGGQATVMTASNTDAVSTYNIGAAIAHHPASTYRAPVLVPTFYTAGYYEDDWCPYQNIKYMYELRSNQPKPFIAAKDTDHNLPKRNNGPWIGYSINFFNCHLLDSDYDCEAIYGESESDPCSLCSCPSVVDPLMCFTD